MPTILRLGRSRFFFYSNEGSEPPHIHIEQEGGVAKFWLETVSLASSSRLGARELRRLERLVIEHRSTLLAAWNDYFGS